MSARSALERGRVRAEALMVDTCEIRDLPTVGEIDPVTGERPTVPGPVIYGPDIAPHYGKCKVQTYEPHESTPQSGQHVYSVQRYSIHVPVGAPARVDLPVTVMASVLDASLVGRTYRVAGLLHKTYATANRLLVDEIVR